MFSAKIFDDGFVCAVCEHHPARDALTREAYLQYPHAVATFGSNVLTVEELAVEGEGLAIDDRILVPSFTGLLFQLSGTQLIATIQRRLANLLAPGLPIKLLEPPVPIGVVQETMIWHERNDLDPAHHWLRGLLAKAASALA